MLYLALPLAAVEREGKEAFPLDTADVVWTFTEGARNSFNCSLMHIFMVTREDILRSL